MKPDALQTGVIPGVPGAVDSRTARSVERLDESPVHLLAPACLGDLGLELRHARLEPGGRFRGRLLRSETKPAYELNVLRMHPAEHVFVHPPGLRVTNRLLEPLRDRLLAVPFELE